MVCLVTLGLGTLERPQEPSVEGGHRVATAAALVECLPRANACRSLCGCAVAGARLVPRCVVCSTRASCCVLDSCLDVLVSCRGRALVSCRGRSRRGRPDTRHAARGAAKRCARSPPQRAARFGSQSSPAAARRVPLASCPSTPVDINQRSLRVARQQRQHQRLRRPQQQRAHGPHHAAGQLQRAPRRHTATQASKQQRFAAGAPGRCAVELDCHSGGNLCSRNLLPAHIIAFSAGERNPTPPPVSTVKNH